ncbi:cyclophane-forming radical SAM/SPASM peptide maturase YhhB [Mesorhizobium sp.]|uniref:cyclophane-forming radical SAM/SPASM peptide maturase YhhB n=2 Tax=Mesorhizobium sp. TaxID=1871066 RepID=UPI000FE31685|nr:cyclophane-forming radical SAM/SPASM peptide maturase YhhB [Mesorhizobium sp.]RWF86260.1 MAG: FxsB family radical SAM/SPASM domain protein [Mesorhizobium sp.]RWG07102.1 MAG: FxsB family radical SAM/SPASM domain protein [Mesorhizobium sp.]RWH02081.1 MAG: FxsB family radical SAM/SPASM domain protein [Mesorhizobium sp.]RWH39665.1 MAG: FxsB family radical SAM/SPASM domain protein [Mesorhizobium sp.]RWH47992.1 MAG: FxsB family radical SAM/SPASM domain protein [Mesorhizobium sp.]
MTVSEAPPRITSFLVKVASRCNLDCDYCYVYHHADQSWRSMPKLLSADDRFAFVERLATYLSEESIKRCTVIFHGGEPLLAGVETLVAFADQIRAATPSSVDIGVQTNGLLLSEAALTAFEAADISISLSLDGPKYANDKHRNSKKGRSSFERVQEALGRLKRHSKIFAGVIAVIDPTTPAEDLLAFFAAHDVPKLDFLLPDAHHLRPPAGRSEQPDLYEAWLCHAFDVWLDDYPQLPIRTFEALLDAVAGLPSSTDAFGLGDVSLIGIETDGSYHDLDVLKVTKDGATRIGGAVTDTAISSIASSDHLAAHRQLLSKPGLSVTCQECAIVDICGGGSLPHRYGANGFDNPTVYCGEMTALVAHIRRRVQGLLDSSARPAQALSDAFRFDRYESAEFGAEEMAHLCAASRQALQSEFLEAARFLPPDEFEKVADLGVTDPERLAELCQQPGAVAWQRTLSSQNLGRVVHTVDGQPLSADADYLGEMLDRPADKLSALAVAREDSWLRKPFGDAIYFETEAAAAQARPVVEEALQIVEAWRPALAAEIRMACRAVQFVRDPLAHPEKIVSFSDNTVPGALYVSVWQGDRLIDPYDLADSLIHEHRHQKLYLLERISPTVEPTEMRVVSPWREDLRPPSGLLHAVFVFVELRRFWEFVRQDGPARLHNRAVNQIRDTDEHLAEAFATLLSCPLTQTGRSLTEVLKKASEPALEAA